MASSGKTVAANLLIKPDSKVWLSDAAYADRLQLLSPGARIVAKVDEAGIAVAFAESAASLRDLIESEGERLTKPDALWIAYPKGNRADINRDSLWPIVAEYGIGPPLTSMKRWGSSSPAPPGRRPASTTRSVRRRRRITRTDAASAALRNESNRRPS